MERSSITEIHTADICVRLNTDLHIIMQSIEDKVGYRSKLLQYNVLFDRYTIVVQKIPMVGEDTTSEYPLLKPVVGETDLNEIVDAFNRVVL